MSSPSLSDLGKREPAAAAAEERGTQQRRACANATWNSIHNGVIAVFQRKGLPDQELFSLNEGVRQLLKTELGSFFTEYLQNQLLTKGMVILRDKIRFYEGESGAQQLDQALGHEAGGRGCWEPWHRWAPGALGGCGGSPGREGSEGAGAIPRGQQGRDQTPGGDPVGSASVPISLEPKRACLPSLPTRTPGDPPPASLRARGEPV